MARSTSSTTIVGTEISNKVDAGLLLVDNLSTWTQWNDNPCDADARNAVVTAIGQEIDKAVKTVKDLGGTIDNIVIVGGDGVIPMAAVPDLTEYSNESTFAREILSAGKSNSVSGTVGSGYLLSDDPYATDAGISILGGDHELYVPERNIGRLVETADEIIGQLVNFRTYGGRLDPSTFNDTATAAVTGYDFLDDGAQAIQTELESAGFNVTSLLDGTDTDPVAPGIQLWDRYAYLGLLAGADYSVISRMPHYDFESLLPAAADNAGFFTDARSRHHRRCQASTRHRSSSLIFTVGCHAGLSVSDVQLGLRPRSTGRSSTRGATTSTSPTPPTATATPRSSPTPSGSPQLFAGNVAAMTGRDRRRAGVARRRRARRQAAYLASTLVLTPYDEKIMQSWTYYGLPMYTIGDIVAASTAPPTATGDHLLNLERAPALAAPVSQPGHVRHAGTNGVVPVVDRPRPTPLRAEHHHGRHVLLGRRQHDRRPVPAGAAARRRRRSRPRASP